MRAFASATILTAWYAATVRLHHSVRKIMLHRINVIAHRQDADSTTHDYYYYNHSTSLHSQLFLLTVGGSSV